MKKADFSEFRRRCGRPQRIVWAVAKDGDIRSICPLGWKMQTSGAPSQIAVSVGTDRCTHGLIERSGEFVLAWPGEDLAKATLYCGTHSARDVDKFEELSLETSQGEFVGAPLVAQAVANVECRVEGKLRTGDHTIFVGEILRVWVNENAKRLLCLVDESAGVDVILEHGGYRFGAIK